MLEEMLNEGVGLLPIVLVCSATEETREFLLQQLENKDSALWQFADGRMCAGVRPEPGVALQ